MSAKELTQVCEVRQREDVGRPGENAERHACYHQAPVQGGRAQAGNLK